VVKIVREKEKAKLRKMYLYFIIVPSYKISLLIFILISSFWSKIQFNFCIQSLSHSSSVQEFSHVP
jgi:fatty-acid desaturase